MIELTNEQILGLNQSLSDLQDRKVALNIKVSYKDLDPTTRELTKRELKK